MKINTKLISAIVILVSLPSLFISTIAYNESKKNMELQETSTKELVDQEVQVQVQAYQDVVDSLHSFAAENIQINMNVAREKLKEMCGNYVSIDEEDNEVMVCENGIRINDKQHPSDLVKEIKKIVKGESSIFVKINNDQAKKISTTVSKGLYVYGYMMEDNMFNTVVRAGQFYNQYSKIQGVFKTKNCDPIRDKDRNVVGTLCVGIPETEIVDKLKSKLGNIKFGVEGHIYVISDLENVNRGELIVHNKKQGENGLEIPYVHEILENKRGVINYTEEGVEKTAAFDYYEPYNWIIVAENTVPKSDASVESVRNIIVFSAVIFLFLALIVGVFISHLISYPIKKLTRAVLKIAEGDINVSLPKIATKDEVKDLSSAVELLVGALKYLKKNENKNKEEDNL